LFSDSRDLQEPLRDFVISLQPFVEFDLRTGQCIKLLFDQVVYYQDIQNLILIELPGVVTRPLGGMLLKVNQPMSYG